MMDPSSHDLQHQQAELLLGSSPLAAAAPHFHFHGSNHEWNQTLMLSGGANIFQDINGVVSTSRNFRLSHETPLPAPLSTPKVHDLGFHWGASNLNAESYMSQSPLSQIKEELSDTSTIEDYHLPSTNCIKPQPQGFHELHEKFLMRSFSSGCQINGLQTPASSDLLFDNPSLTGFGEVAMRGRGNFSMVLPSTHVSSSIPQPLPFSSSLGMDLHALDLLTSARFGRPLPQPSINSIPCLKESIPYGLGILQELSQGQENGHLKIPSLIINGVSEEKRSNSLLEHKASQAAPKKPRLESRPSFSPFKVRKEKLGDRIAALQQLVAPFGKTDTASVLMEAIGYIKFLQDQVETLSVPYMRPGNKKLRTMQGASSEEEPRLDLRSRGLCLVPLSCTSYVTNDNGGTWSPPNFRGGT